MEDRKHIIRKKDLNNFIDINNLYNTTLSDTDLKNIIQQHMNNGICYDTLSPDWKIDIKGGVDKAKHIIKSSKYGKLNKSKLARHRKYIANIKDLIEHSKYTNNPKPNQKLAKKPNVITYHYFETFVKIKETTYRVILHTEQYKNDSTMKPQTVHLYDVIEEK